MEHITINERIGKFIIIENDEMEHEMKVFTVEKVNMLENAVDEILLQNNYKQRAVESNSLVEKIEIAFKECYEDIATHPVCEMEYRMEY